MMIKIGLLISPSCILAKLIEHLPLKKMGSSSSYNVIFIYIETKMYFFFKKGEN